MFTKPRCNRDGVLLWSGVRATNPVTLADAVPAAPTEEHPAMCDYSLKNVRSRKAKVGDMLRTHNFDTGTRGFIAVSESNMAVCVLPGTEIAFEKKEVMKCNGTIIKSGVAIFRQINKDKPNMHHDALEFPNGGTVLLTDLVEGQYAEVLQLPAQPKTEAEVQAQKRLPIDA